MRSSAAAHAAASLMQLGNPQWSSCGKVLCVKRWTFRCRMLLSVPVVAIEKSNTLGRDGVCRRPSCWRITTVCVHHRGYIALAATLEILILKG